MTFCFSHRPQISNFPILFLFQYMSPLFRENYHFPPTLTNCISFPPYFDHDAFMHHPMHVLDAPVYRPILVFSGFRFSSFHSLINYASGVNLVLNLRDRDSGSNRFRFFQANFRNISISFHAISPKNFNFTTNLIFPGEFPKNFDFSGNLKK